MKINWIDATGKTFKPTADVEVRFSNGKCKQYAIKIKAGALATKLGNTDRMMVGFDDSFTMMCFMPTTEKTGYKVVRGANPQLPVNIYISEPKMKKLFPTLSPSRVVGTYSLKFAEGYDFHYISIGALPR